ncbi:cytochrome P450 monooxygenase GliC2 [Aspergillus leporis]|uniref:Cytochrome P450 monooxygenase GliC2 n=1 Tax=Aspergillus leporis TaxID=41062 RepID=A0A5N5WP98_9EURO|nr:cytochrome P450 monooxygenase GliC2 [Aspergillus leporis]
MRTIAKKKTIRGPLWQWPNGQIVDKFLLAKQCSFQWQRYGPVYRIWAFATPEIVITSSEDIKSFYSDGHRHQKAESSNAGWLFRQVLGRCVGLINGEDWRHLRSHLENPLSYRATMARRERVFQQARDYIQNDFPRYANDDYISSSSPRHLVVNPVTALQWFPFFHMAEVFYGSLSTSERAELQRIGQLRVEIFREVVQGGVVNRFGFLSRLLQTSASRLADQFLREWRNFNTRIYRRQLHSNEDAPIVSLWGAVEGNRLRATEVLHSLDESLFANLDVTTHVLTWAIVQLAQHSPKQDELREDIRAHATDSVKYVNSKTTLLHYTFLEALRLRPVGAFSVPESSPEEKVLGGFCIPPNTDVVVDSYAVNVRNPFWGKNNLDFCPRRFENINPRELRYNLMTFGFGPRQCLGQHDAERTIKSLVYHLVNEYHFTLRGGQMVAGDLKIDDRNWVALSDVELELRRADEPRTCPEAQA